MRQWVRNAAPSRAAGVRGSLGGSTCPRPDGHPQRCGSRNSGRQEMNGDPRGGGAVAPGPRPRENEKFGGRLPPATLSGSPKPGRGAPSRAGLIERGGGRAEARAGPSGLLTSAMSCSSRPPAPRRTRSLLRLCWARSHRAGPREARSGPDREAEPAGRAQTPLQAWGSRRLCSRPPSPVRSSSSPAYPHRRCRDVTPRDARRHFLLPLRPRLSGGW